jgi:hypothetical protein
LIINSDYYSAFFKQWLSNLKNFYDKEIVPVQGHEYKKKHVRKHRVLFSEAI